MRKALVVGIDHYAKISPLFGCVNDAYSVQKVLERHSDGTVNFAVVALRGTGPKDVVTREALKDAARQLFADDPDVALFYFAGHGHIESTGGYLCAGDSKTGDDGLSLAELLILANKSAARNRVIILDSCHSGIAGSDPEDHKATEALAEGITILTASTAEQYATEEDGSGVFTTLLVDALEGAAANLVGDVTPGSVYAHIDQSLGPWEQRPVFKTNVKSFVSLRKTQPPIDLADLLRLTEFFPKPGFEFALDPSYEPERPKAGSQQPGLPDPNPAHTAIFAVLQKFNRVGLLKPVGAPHMWHAAMESKTVKLTVLGEHYRRLVDRERL